MNSRRPLFRKTAVQAALILALPALAGAQTTSPPTQVAAADVKALERVTVTGSRPASMPIEIPTTTESHQRRADRADASTPPTPKTR